MLPPHDSAYLAERFQNHAVTVMGGMICVLLPAFELGSGFNVPVSDLLLRLAPGYPDIGPDMWWFSPHIHRVDGQKIPATEVVETFFNKPWQRWSRHLSPGQWCSAVDSLESYLSLVRRELAKAAERSAA